ncbi:MAG: hypothetical protein P4L74_06220 [Candidatus Doudnabacteria bacterium]|nr:hypothetical protein [Candidatus Doudnabacteria bacterium]
MNRKNFLLFFLLEWLLTAALKIWLFNYQVFANLGSQQILFWIITVVITAAIVRRFGYISLFEMAVVAIFWTVAGMFLDLILTSKFTGLGMFRSQAYWDSFGIMIAALFLFHKKRHILARHKLHAAKLAAQHAADHPSEAHMPDIKRH